MYFWCFFVRSGCCVFVAGKPGECGKGGSQAGGQHDPSGGKPTPHQSCNSESESGP